MENNFIKIKEELKNSYTHQKNFIEKLVSISANNNENVVLSFLKLLLKLIEELEFPFAYLFNDTNYLQNFVQLYYETQYTETIEKIFYKLISKFDFENGNFSSKLNILSYANLIGLKINSIKRENNLSLIESIYCDHVNLIMDCDFLKKFLEDNSIKESLDETNIKEILNRISKWNKILSNFNSNDFSIYLKDFFNELKIKTEKYEEFFDKFSEKNIEGKNNINYNFEDTFNLDPRFRTSFYIDEKLQFLESLNIEYKNYSWPLSVNLTENLKKQICGFLNSSGGRIYIGISDDQIIKGVYLNSKARDLARNSIVNYTIDFFPKCRTNKIEVVYIPIKNRNENIYINNLWIIKIIIKQGEVDKLYSMTSIGFQSTIRMPGQCVVLSAAEIVDEITKRKYSPRLLIDENDFIDVEPENPIEIGDDIIIDEFISEKSNDKKLKNLHTLSVQSIPKTANKEQVLKLFKDTNYVSEKIFLDKDGFCKGWAFFNYITENDAASAFTKTKTGVINGIKLSIKLK